MSRMNWKQDARPGSVTPTVADDLVIENVPLRTVRISKEYPEGVAVGEREGSLMPDLVAGLGEAAKAGESS